MKPIPVDISVADKARHHKVLCEQTLVNSFSDQPGEVDSRSAEEVNGSLIELVLLDVKFEVELPRALGLGELSLLI
jgi:hypothetical protein